MDNEFEVPPVSRRERRLAEAGRSDEVATPVQGVPVGALAAGVQPVSFPPRSGVGDAHAGVDTQFYPVAATPHRSQPDQQLYPQPYARGQAPGDFAAPPRTPSAEPAYSYERPPRRRGFDFLSVVGELLLTAGVIVGLFAFWQVYVTDWQVANKNQGFIASFENELVAPPNQISTDIRHGEPPGVGEIWYGKPFATMHVPRWDYLVIPVLEGIGNDVLDRGAAGHYTQTQLPNELGNFAVAAHRRSWGSNFRRVEELEVGDPIILETKDAWLVYKVINKKIVDPDYGSVILPVPEQPGVAPDKYLMTMTTCHPEYGNSERYIVFSQMDHWIPRNTGIPAELAQGVK